MDSIDNIWDAPVEPSSPRRPTPAPAPADSDNEPLPRTRPSTNRRPLFLESDDEDEPQVPAPPAAVAPNVDAIFASALDDENFESEPMPPPLDINEIQRQAEQRHALSQPTILPGLPLSNAEVTKGNEPNAPEANEKKARKKQIVLNEARLLDTTYGFPRLIEMMNGFEPKGKGHEAGDLNRLLSIYQFWTHQLYPKTQFKDTVDRVERLCHSRRMHVALSVWHDAAKGVHNPVDATDLTSDAEKSDSNAPNTHGKEAEATKKNFNDDDAHIIPSGPPSSRSSPPLEHDFDVDESMQEERLTRTTGTPIDDDADLWVDLPIPDDLDPILVSPQPQDDPMQEDESSKQMDADTETNVEGAWRDPLTSKTTGLAEQLTPSGGIDGTNDEDIDDLYG